MLPLKSFRLNFPKNLPDLFMMLETGGLRTKIMAGGTDLIPNLKHGLYDIDQIISLKKLSELRTIDLVDNHLRIGALINLCDIGGHPHVNRLLKGLAKASLHIASPQIRNMGTVGGNICLDTRCLYFNQSEFWRASLGYCLKKDGCACHVIKAGKRCVAAASNDLATALLAYDAYVTLSSPNETTHIRLDDFYSANGEKNNVLKPNQVVTMITIDLAKDYQGGFFKLRHRHSVDFALLSAAAALKLDHNHCLLGGRVCINALVAKPKVIDLAEWKGFPYNQSLVNNIARMTEDKCHPQTNICDDKSWRKNMVAYCVKQALGDAIGVRD